MSDHLEPPMVLDERSITGVARYIQSKDCKRIFVMTGAGISTAAGIPDFRSPDTGLYANLARLKLPYPEAVFDIRYFRKNPLPFYTLAHELAPGRYRPTKTHSFIRLLHEKKYLHTCFTQNIDTLERRAGLPNDRIIEAHGSFATQRCIDCKVPYDDDKMKRTIREKQVPRCEVCDGLVKPDIVFFGEALPPEFHKSIYNLPTADLLIIIGTSLTVHPFASLTGLVPESCPRVLINLDPVGDIGSRVEDVVVLGKCDNVVEQLCTLLGWEKELDELWAETADSLDPEQIGDHPPELDIEEEVKKLAEEVKETLRLKKKLKEEHEADAKAAAVGRGEEPAENEHPIADAESSLVDVREKAPEKEESASGDKGVLEIPSKDPGTDKGVSEPTSGELGPTAKKNEPDNKL
ncbi:NAD-dependent deacetylase sirtuin-2 [Hysterangium stoloniferum]|nr:NAD-dependent deacetylase sirtuin-2 [Hysterangium stoloniferum]